jgi:RNA polymerase sigma-70 factor (ECF subfamily)
MESRGAKSGSFPSTNWEQLDSLRSREPADRRATLGTVIAGYWKPLNYYLRRRGCDPEQAKDLVQGFLTDAIEKQLFARGRRERGRFRSFLLSSFNHYVLNARRSERANKRHPEGGLLLLDDAAEASEPLFLKTCESPEAVFHRAWISDLILRVLRNLERELTQAGRAVHYAIFAQRVVNPALDGVDAPSLMELSQSYHLTAKEAANRLLTARRAYQRLLRDEIALYLGSDEEVDEELDDILRFLAGH